jgi:hypothetical protein
LRRTLVGHVDEAKTPGLAGVTIGNEPDRLYLPIRLEELADILFRRCKRKIPDKNMHASILWKKDREIIARSSEQYAGAQGAAQYAGEAARQRLGITREVF